MGWIYVLFAAIIEVFWVIGLRYSSTTLEWIGTIIAIVLSFYFIIKASEFIPSGTVYAVFTGSGAVAIVLIDILVFDASFSMSQILLIGLIMVGVIGIKITTDEKSHDATNQTVVWKED
ncbi:MAG TPA: multidrug efflux SMR transporter [Bacillota bacterium]|nr:multidrug efflux SMR transporter [Bacillota bacterium]